MLGDESCLQGAKDGFQYSIEDKLEITKFREIRAKKQRPTVGKLGSNIPIFHSSAARFCSYSLNVCNLKLPSARFCTFYTVLVLLVVLALVVAARATTVRVRVR